jgi:hypothetical protein
MGGRELEFVVFQAAFRHTHGAITPAMLGIEQHDIQG